MANACTDALAFVSDNRARFTAILREALAGAQVQGSLEASAELTGLADYLFMCYNGLQVLVQTDMDREALTTAVSRCVDTLPWTTPA